MEVRCSGTKAVQEKATEVEGQVPGQTRVSVRGSDPAPRTRPKNRKAQIAAAAAEAFSERGYHAVGIDEIAAKVGISGPALYRHFPTKYALFVYTVNNLTQALLDASDPAVHGNENPREQLNSTMVGVIPRDDRESAPGRALPMGGQVPGRRGS